MKQAIPVSIQGLVWSKNGSQLDLNSDSSAIIHYTLRYGRISDISWLLGVYPKEKIHTVFTTQPMTIYSPASFQFVKNAVLNIVQDIPNEQRYIQSFS